MMAQEYTYLAPKVGAIKAGFQRQSSYGSHQMKRNSWTSQGKNRLGPYTTTHPSAQSKALEMLNLQPTDVFFDLGCSDGRLLVMALQEAIDKEIEDRRKALLSKPPRTDMTRDRSRCDERNEECLLGECCHVMRRHSSKTKGSHGDVGNPLTLQYCHSAPSIQGDSLLDSGDEGHRRNHSLESFAVPHLMRNSSNDSNFDDILDDLSDFDLAVQQRTSCSSAAPTLYDSHDEKSPVTPLISNRKTLKEETGKTNEPPLELRHSEAEEVLVDQDRSEMNRLKTIHLPNTFDGSIDADSGKSGIFFKYSRSSEIKRQGPDSSISCQTYYSRCKRMFAMRWN